MEIKQQVEHWLDNIVIGLGFCPFASHSREQNLIDIVIDTSNSLEGLMSSLVDQCIRLNQTPRKELETLLLVIPELLGNFDDYLDCLELANQLITEQGFDGHLQIASFHPDYQFEGTEPEDSENLTNRSPYPIFHLLRQASVTDAIAAYGDTAEIPNKNKETISALSNKTSNALFHYLSVNRP